MLTIECTHRLPSETWQKGQDAFALLLKNKGLVFQPDELIATKRFMPEGLVQITAIFSNRLVISDLAASSKNAQAAAAADPLDDSAAAGHKMSRP